LYWLLPATGCIALALTLALVGIWPGRHRRLDDASELRAGGAARGLHRHAFAHGGDVAGQRGGLGGCWEVSLRLGPVELLADHLLVGCAAPWANRDYHAR